MKGSMKNSAANQQQYLRATAQIKIRLQSIFIQNCPSPPQKYISSNSSQNMAKSSFSTSSTTTK
jgi:hypothetical protein